MQIDPVNRIGMSLPANSTVGTTSAEPVDNQVVLAVQTLNRSELMSEDRTLAYRRDPKTGHLVIQLQTQNGDVVDQIPPEIVLRLYAELQEELKTKEPNE